MRKRLSFRVFLIGLMVILSISATQIALGETFRVAVPCGSEHPFLDGFKAAFEEFKEEYGYLDLELELMLGTNLDKITMQVVSGVPPEVFMIDGSVVVTAAFNEILHPLTSYIEASRIDSESFILPSWRQNVWDGQIWALPVTVDPNFGLVYNKRLFQESGLDYPKNPSLYDYQSLFPKLVKRDVDGEVIQVAQVAWNTWLTGFTWGWIFGGSFYDYKANRVTADDPKIIAAFSWLRDMRDRYVINTFDWSAFVEETSAMGFGNSEHVHNLLYTERWKAGDMDIGITSMPSREPRQSSTWIGGWCLSIPAGVSSEISEISWEFIKYTTCSDEGTLAFSENAGTFPGLKSSPVFTELYLGNQYMEPFLEIVLSAQYQRPVTPIQQSYYHMATEALGSVFEGSRTPEEALSEISRILQNELDNLTR